MARIQTTIWDLAAAIIDEADAATDFAPEADILAFAALADTLHRSTLIETQAAAPPSLRVRQNRALRTRDALEMAR